MTTVFASDQLFVQPTAPSRWDIKMNTKPVIPVNHDRAIMMNLISSYNYYLSHLQSPALVWITSKPNSELIDLAKDILSTVTIITVTPASTSTRRRQKVVGDFTDAKEAVASLKDKEVCLFWSDSISELSDEQAISEIVIRTKMIDELKPRYFVTEFKWYTPRIVINGGELPSRYVKFFAGQLFKTPWLNQNSNYTVTIIGTSDSMIEYDWYDIYGKLAYHNNVIRIMNRYKSPVADSDRKATLTVQTTKIYEEYSNQWDATAELQLLVDLVGPPKASESNLIDIALLSTAITTVISTPVADNSVYNLYQRLIK